MKPGVCMQWYEGVIKQFDAFRWSHTVEYDDGDTEVWGTLANCRQAPQ